MSEKELAPVEASFNSVKFTPASFIYPADMFDSMDARLDEKYDGVKTEFEGQWKTEISDLKKFIDGAKSYLKNMESALLSDFSAFNSRAKRTIKLAENKREWLVSENNLYTQQRRNALIAEVDAYVAGKDWGVNIDPRKFVYPDCFSNLTMPFSEKVAELNRQADEMDEQAIKKAKELLLSEKLDKEQALNYELIVKQVADLNSKHGTNIPASEFVKLKELHPVEAKEEVIKYFEHLKDMLEIEGKTNDACLGECEDSNLNFLIHLYELLNGELGHSPKQAIESVKNEIKDFLLKYYSLEIKNS